MNEQITITRFEFANIEALYFLVAIPIIILLFALYSNKRDKHIAKSFKIPYSATQYVALGTLWSLVLVGLVGVMASPQINTYGTQEDRFCGDYVFLVDTSLSMGARPSLDENSRLETSQETMIAVSNSMCSRFLIYGYAGMAEPLSGFVDNPTELKDFIEYGVYVDMFPLPGSDLTHALARVVYEKKENPNYENVTHVILFSDGRLRTEHEASVALPNMLTEVRLAGLTVVVVGVGSHGPEKIPFFDAQGRFTGEYYKVRETGTEFVAELWENNLRLVADSTGGQYFHQSQSEELINYLQSTMPDIPPTEIVGEMSPLGNRSISWIFAVLSFSFFVLIVLNSRKFYF